MPELPRICIVSLLLFSALGHTALADDFVWTNGADNGAWHDPGNWLNTTRDDPESFPGGGDHVSFGGGISGVATTTNGAAASMNVTGVFGLSPGTLTVGGLSNSGVFEFFGAVSFSDEVLSFAAGDSVISGSGQIVMKEYFDSSIRLSNPNHSQTVTNAAGHTIRGTGKFELYGVEPAFINEGAISVEAGGMIVNGGGTVADSFTNNGLIDVADGETIQFFYVDNLAFGPSSTLQTNSSGVIELLASTLSNTTVELAGDGTFLLAVSNLDEVTINDGSTVTLDTHVNRVVGTLTNNGMVRFQGGESTTDEVLAFTGDAVLAGTGEVVMTESNDSKIQISSQTVTNAAGHTIRGTGEFEFSGAEPTFINNGTISVEAGGMDIDGAGTVTESFTNNGLINVADGETLRFLYVDTLTLGATSVLQTNSSGVIEMLASTLSNATVELTGDGTFLLTGVNLDAVTINDGSTVTLDTGVNRVVGTLTNNGVVRFLGDDQTGADEALAFTGDAVLAGTGEVVMTETLVSMIRIGSQTVTNAAGHTIRGTGEIEISGTDPAFINDGVLSVEAGGMIVDGAGTATDSFTSNGLIDVADGETLRFLNVNAITFGSSSTLQTNSSGVIETFNSNLSNATVELAGDGTLLLNGANLDAVTINDGSTVTLDTGVNRVVGTLTNNGVVRFLGDDVSNVDEVLAFTGDAVLAGTGEFVMTEFFDSKIRISSQTVTNAAGHTIRGAGEIEISGTDPAFINNGVVLADIPGQVLDLNSGPANFDSATNTITNGVFAAANGGLLRFYGADIDTNQAEIRLDGVGSTIIDHFGNDALADLATNDTGAALRVLGGRDFSTAAAGFANRGEVELGGGVFNAATFDNQATRSITGFGTVAPRPTNAGSVRAVGGTLAFSNGVEGGGVIEATDGSTVDLSAGSDSSAGQLTLRSGGGLTMGSRAVAVNDDYQNENAGTGNAYDPRAGVSGSGPINSSVAKTQSLTGDVTGGATATPNIDFGDVRAGQEATASFRVNNSLGGPALRGAVKTSGDGADLASSAHIALAGGAQTFGPIAAGGQSGDFTVTLTGSTAGAASGTLAVVNNFDNVADQVVTVTATAFRLAEPTIETTPPIDFGIVHVGDVVTPEAVAVRNQATADGFSEGLDAAFAGASPGVVTSGAGIDNLAAGSTDNTGLLIGIDATTAGVINGTAQIAFTSDGAGVNTLGQTALLGQSIAVTATVNNFANAVLSQSSGDGVLTEPTADAYVLDLGGVRNGQGDLSAELELTNLIAAPADDLAGSWMLGSSGFGLSGFEAFSNLAAGDSIDGLTVTLGDTTPGVFSHTITLSSRSTNASGFDGALAPITVELSGVVFLPGDYNADGSVTEADYTVWRASFGSTANLDADGNNDGRVNAADYTVWRNNLGGGLPALSFAAAVPEPTGICLLLTTLMVATRKEFRRRMR
ncbi:beta strand repeat-containing protein [Aeoliella sp.]|uniref:beta strand repeat-containing protein n=1 Tax=Aeoliella sp. TaxID=2795800 RepID=UPI003CCBB710